ncbi:hypothetical protein MD484_g8738, partial [Candolleomyces efflorescens]
MEYHCFDQADVARRIFDKGMERFSSEVEYVCRHLGFLISTNAKNDARALFERASGTFAPEKARPLWEMWSRYESQYGGDLESTLKLGKRVSETYPNGEYYIYSPTPRFQTLNLRNDIQDPAIKIFAQRHIYSGIDAIAARDLGAAYAKRHTARSTATTPPSSQESSTTKTTQSSKAGGSQSAIKRPASPDKKDGVKREKNGGGATESGYKRIRAGASPVRDNRDVPMRDRERRRDREVIPPHPSAVPVREIKREQPIATPRPNRANHEDKVRIPPAISWFIGELPPASSFDGPVLPTDDFLDCLKHAIIPSSRQSATNDPPPIPPPRARSPETSPPTIVTQFFS